MSASTVDVHKINAQAVVCALRDDNRLKALGNNGRMVIGVFGIPGSGKTTLCSTLSTMLKREFPDLHPALMAMDGYHYSRSALSKFPNPEEAHSRRGAPFTFDVEAFLSTLRCFRTARDVLPIPGFNHAEKDPVPDETEIKPQTQLLLVEGNYLGLRDFSDERWTRSMRSLIDFTVNLDVDVDVAMSRVLRRHVYEMDLTVLEARVRIERNDRPNAILVKENAIDADLVISNN